MKPSRVLLLLLRIGVAFQVIIGIGLWTGHMGKYVGLHQNGGMVFVLLLWAIAVVAISKRDHVGLAIVAILWGVLVAALGMTQMRLLPGNLHWIVRVAHLLIGLAAMPIAERLAKDPVADTMAAGGGVQA
jgi:hypothetical protein